MSIIKINIEISPITEAFIIKNLRPSLPTLGWEFVKKWDFFFEGPTPLYDYLL